MKVQRACQHSAQDPLSDARTARRGLFDTAFVTRVPQCPRLRAAVTIAIAAPAVTRVAESATVAQS
jgi:hypothetical protein